MLQASAVRGYCSSEMGPRPKKSHPQPTAMMSQDSPAKMLEWMILKYVQIQLAQIQRHLKNIHVMVNNGRMTRPTARLTYSNRLRQR
jgi:hypothetical protein